MYPSVDEGFVPVKQEGWRWIGNSSKATDDEAIEEYAGKYLGQTLMAVDFGPGDSYSIVKWSVFVKV